jgi:hypothetical protein
MRAPWGDGARPILFDALDVTRKTVVRSALLAGGALELWGGDRVGKVEDGGKSVTPTRLVLARPPESHPFSAWYRPESSSSDLAGAARHCAMSHVKAALLQISAHLGDTEAAGPAPITPPRLAGRDFGERHLVASMEACTQHLGPDLGPLFRSWVLEPARNRHHGGLPFDNDVAERLLVGHVVWSGLADAEDPGWRRATARLLLLAAHATPTTIDEVVDSYRGTEGVGPRRGAASFPTLRRDRNRPLTLLYGRRDSALLRQTWRWLLPRGSEIRRGVNQLDDALAPLDGGLTLVG